MENHKKIGIITFHAADNYGAVLQAYALQTYISTQGHEAEIIDFAPDSVKKANTPLFVHEKSFVKKLIKQILIIPNYFKLKKRNRKFNEFRNAWLKRSQHFGSSEEIRNSTHNYDLCITGSDQVFNPLIKNSDIYYLDFCNGIKKMAYAPSFGIKDFSNVGDNTKKLIKDFDYLSCREADGAEFLSTVIGETVPVVSDPVFLLSPEEWSKITQKPQKEKYIFVYDLNGGNSLIEIANKIKAETNLPIICVTTKKYANTRYNVDELHCNFGPEEFVSYIQHAEYVVTDSFHGLAFSVLFNRKVVSFIALKHAASRIQSLLERLGIADRLFYNTKDFNFKDIEFRDYKEKLSALIDTSKQYLSAINK